jgi:hypothetical protein
MQADEFLSGSELLSAGAFSMSMTPVLAWSAPTAQVA